MEVNKSTENLFISCNYQCFFIHSFILRCVGFLFFRRYSCEKNEGLAWALCGVFSAAVLFSLGISVGNKNILQKNKMVLHTFDNQKYVIKIKNHFFENRLIRKNFWCYLKSIRVYLLLKHGYFIIRFSHRHFECFLPDSCKKKYREVTMCVVFDKEIRRVIILY